MNTFAMFVGYGFLGCTAVGACILLVIVISALRQPPPAEPTERELASIRYKAGADAAVDRLLRGEGP